MPYREKAKLPDEHEAVIETMNWIDKEAMWERAKIFVWLIVPVLTSLGFLGWAIYKCFTVPKVVSFCYITSTDKEAYYLYGNVDWHDDRRYGSYPVLDEALAAAKKLGCEVK